MPCGVCMVCTAGAELTGHKTVMDDMKVSTAVCKCHCVYEPFLGVHEALCNSHYRVSNLMKRCQGEQEFYDFSPSFSQNESFWYVKHYVTAAILYYP